jgi:hypothetical protein
MEPSKGPAGHKNNVEAFRERNGREHETPERRLRE